MHFPHRLELHPSRWLAALLIPLHLAAMLGLIPLALPLWLKLALAVAIAAAGIGSLRDHAWCHRGAPLRELVLKADGTVEGVRADGSRFEAKVSRQSTLWPLLIVLLLERAGASRRQSLIVLPDALSVEDLRMLRSWLRWKLI